MSYNFDLICCITCAVQTECGVEVNIVNVLEKMCEELHKENQAEFVKHVTNFREIVGHAKELIRFSKSSTMYRVGQYKITAGDSLVRLCDIVNQLIIINKRRVETGIMIEFRKRTYWFAVCSGELVSSIS